MYVLLIKLDENKLTDFTELFKLNKLNIHNLILGE